MRNALIAVAAVIGGIILLGLAFFFYNQFWKERKDEKDVVMLAAGHRSNNATSTRPFDEPTTYSSSRSETGTSALYDQQQLHQQDYYSADPGALPQGYIVTTTAQQQYYGPNGGYYVDSNYGPYDPNDPNMHYDPNYYAEHSVVGSQAGGIPYNPPM